MSGHVLVVQPSTSDPVGRVGTWLTELGCSLVVVDCQRGQPLPTSLAGFDALVVLGGEMGAYDDAVAPWLTDTKNLLRSAVSADLPTLGICLGHQLLAVAAAGAVARADTPQQGLVSVGVTAAGRTDPLFGAVRDAVAAHWNDDLVVTTPPSAVVLARAEGSVQAIRIGTRVYGVQFHPEVDPGTIADWAAEDVAAGRLSEPEAAGRVDPVRAADPQLVSTWRTFVQRFAVLLER